jgi:hypothetical protein
MAFSRTFFPALFLENGGRRIARKSPVPGVFMKTAVYAQGDVPGVFLFMEMPAGVGQV